ncbi:hypothetical protein FRB96_000019 [Tulasnella sp. 330]|nr:hypothetical protein FRB96_000019 [Tulasnella sp. 330]
MSSRRRLPATDLPTGGWERHNHNTLEIKHGCDPTQPEDLMKSVGRLTLVSDILPSSELKELLLCISLCHRWEEVVGEKRKQVAETLLVLVWVAGKECGPSRRGPGIDPSFQFKALRDLEQRSDEQRFSHAPNRMRKDGKVLRWHFSTYFYWSILARPPMQGQHAVTGLLSSFSITAYSIYGMYLPFSAQSETLVRVASSAATRGFLGKSVCQVVSREWVASFGKESKSEALPSLVHTRV